MPTPTSHRNRDRVRKTRVEVEAFECVNRHQKHLQGLILSMLDFIGGVCCEPGEEREFARWWAAVEAYRRVLFAPVMATKRARTILKQVLDETWGFAEWAGIAEEGTEDRQDRAEEEDWVDWMGAA